MILADINTSLAEIINAKYANLVKSMKIKYKKVIVKLLLKMRKNIYVKQKYHHNYTMSSMIIFIAVAAILAIIYLIFYIYGIMLDRRKKYTQVSGGHEKSNIDEHKNMLSGINQINFQHSKTWHQFTPEILATINDPRSINLCHIYPTAEKKTSIHRILDQSKRAAYQRRSFEFKRALHWGQLKLFLTEVEFLTKVLELKPTKKIVMVYAGAAPGHHTKYLQGMFPDIRFELYDPNDFAIENDKMINIHIQFFTDKDAEHWRDTAAKEDLFLVFCTDVRTEPATEENVKRNMAMQLKWWQIMNPELSMFKFRLPWGNSDLP